MSEPGHSPAETGFDTLLGFTVTQRNARGRMVRLGPVLDTILSSHAYPSAIRHVLAEALVLTALMGSLFKEPDSQLTIQAQATGGIVDLLVCDFRAGELRGYVRHDAEKLAALGANPSLFALFGKGYLGVTFDLAATGQRYQGIVPLEGASLAAACEQYFAQSEQVPTFIKVAVRSGSRGSVACGMLVQHLPEGEEGRERLHSQMDHPDWEHVAALAGSVRQAELFDPTLSLEDVVWRLFHDEGEVRVLQGAQITRGCRCTAEYYASVLKQFPEADRAEMREADGNIAVDCAFCSRIFRIAV